jgi:hypothetical protein
MVDQWDDSLDRCHALSPALTQSFDQPVQCLGR